MASTRDRFGNRICSCGKKMYIESPFDAKDAHEALLRHELLTRQQRHSEYDGERSSADALLHCVVRWALAHKLDICVDCLDARLKAEAGAIAALCAPRRAA